MPSFTELAWILEALKLLRRFAPLVERFIAGDRQAFGSAIEPFGAEVRQIVGDSQARLEAQINDLRKQTQEQHLKLNQLQEQVGRVQQDCEHALELARESGRQLAALGKWVKMTAAFAILSSLLAMTLLLRR